MSGHMENLLSLYLDGELSPREADRVKNHLSECSSCSAILDDYQANQSFLKEEPVPPIPLGLETRIKKALQAEFAQKGGSSWGLSHSLPVWGWGASAALGLVALFVWFEKPEYLDIFSKMNPEQALQTASTAANPLPAPQNSLVQKNDSKNKSNLAELDAAPQSQRSSYNIGAKEPVRALAGARLQTVSANNFSRDSVELADNQELLSISGVFSGMSKPQNLVIQDEDQWTQIWEKHSQNIPNPEEKPVIDFDRYHVIAIFSGQKPSAGYKVRLIRLESKSVDNKKAKVIHYQQVTPPAGSLQASVLTQPFLFQTVPSFKETPIFQESPQ